MNCPNCNIGIDFTWSRYIKCTPFIKQACPHCATKFKFERPFTYYIWQLYTLLGFFAILHMKPNYIFIIFTILWAVLYCIVDKDIESKLPTKLYKK